MNWPDGVLDRFRAVRCPFRQGFWRAQCPSHDDLTPSLSLWLGRNGALLVGCWAGCAKDRVLACRGLSMRDLFPPSSRDAYGKEGRHVLPERRIVETYDYRDEQGVLSYQSVRYEPKDFRQRQPLPGGYWKWSLDGVRLVLYRLPEMLAACACEPVLIPEGERKVDRLREIGFVAVCGAGGTGMGWQPGYSQSLRGRRCVVLPDNDACGVRHAFVVAGSLMVHGAAAVRIVALPGLGAGQDVIDYLDAGGTRGGLIRLVLSVPEWRAVTC